MNVRASQRYEMQVDNYANDHDRTLRALEGFSSDGQNIQGLEHDDQRQSDESTEDLFLGLAREDLNRQANKGGGESIRRRVSHHICTALYPLVLWNVVSFVL
jgi:hypothetical protein